MITCDLSTVRPVKLCQSGPGPLFLSFPTSSPGAAPNFPISQYSFIYSCYNYIVLYHLLYESLGGLKSDKTTEITPTRLGINQETM